MNTERSVFIDNIRVLLTILVILHHTAITYGGPGGWYYTEKNESFAAGIILILFVATNQAFFMGLFFFLSSFFIPASYAKKGAVKFMLDRLKRLGIPLVFYSLLIGPATIYLVVRFAHKNQVSFIDYYLHRDHWIHTGVLWFTAALLIFTGIFWVIKQSGTLQHQPPTQRSLPGNYTILLFALALGMITFLVRTIFPVGWTLEPLGFQLAHFPQYIALFMIGIMAYQHRWMSELTWQRGMFWLRVVGVMLLLIFPFIFFLKTITNSPLEAFQGGVQWQSLIISLWEQLTGISIIVALLCIARVKLNKQGAIFKQMSRTAYAVYIIHPFILVAVSVLLPYPALNPLVKVLITGSCAVAASFIVAALLVRLPGVKEVV